jgi:hypothetical protein
LLNLFDRYVHGDIARRDFLDGAKKFAVGGLTAAAIWEKPADFLILQFAFAGGGLAAAELRGIEAAGPWTLLCYWLPYWFLTASSGQPQDRTTIFGLISGSFLLFFTWIVWWTEKRSHAPRGTDLLVLAVNSAAYFAVSYTLLNPIAHEYMGVFAVCLGGLHLWIAKRLWKPETPEDDNWPGLLAAAVTLTFLTLAIPIQFAGFRITIAWALEALALAWLAARFNSEKMRFGAWSLFVFVFCRLVVYDAWIYPNGEHFQAILNARFLTFAVSALCLWLAARLARSGMEAGVPYVAGHIVMLWVLGLEVIGWAERATAAADVSSVETTAISILMAVYALLLVTMGVLTRTPINRMLGLGLLGIVVGKLYLNDIWELSRGFRITAFLGLGGLLLLVSYLYSRFRPVIEKLWKDEG